MPHQGARVGIWILMCLVLVLIWIVTIVLIRALIGGRAASLAPNADPRDGAGEPDA